MMTENYVLYYYTVKMYEINDKFVKSNQRKNDWKKGIFKICWNKN